MATDNARYSFVSRAIFLREHNVARDQLTDGRKTPANFAVSGVIQLVQVSHCTVVDTVSLSAVATYNLEASFGIELDALLGRQPASQKAKATNFTIIFTQKCLVVPRGPAVTL